MTKEGNTKFKVQIAVAGTTLNEDQNVNDFLQQILPHRNGSQFHRIFYFLKRQNPLQLGLQFQFNVLRRQDSVFFLENEFVRVGKMLFPRTLANMTDAALFRHRVIHGVTICDVSGFEAANMMVRDSTFATVGGPLTER